MTQCELFDTMNIRDVCRIMGLKDQLWSEFFQHTEPKIKCPFKKTTIKITDGMVDIGYVAHLPLSGYKWNFVIKVYKSGAGSKARHKTRLLMCLIFELTITKTRPEKKKAITARPGRTTSRFHLVEQHFELYFEIWADELPFYLFFLHIFFTLLFQFYEEFFSWFNLSLLACESN